MNAPVIDRERLAEIAIAAGETLEGATATDIIQWAVDQFGTSWCVASSMADEVLPHIASRVQPGVNVVFLDTGYHFAETIGTRDAVAATLPVTLHTILPRRTVAEQDAEFGPRLYERDPDLCCAMRKVEPLESALAPYLAWATGVRREDSPTRAGTRVVEWDEKRGMVKVNPIAAWTQDDIDTYIAENGVLVNPLAYDGYPSIGCAPCTRRVAEGEDPRAGRWAGLGKSECGLHV
jgi:phosphoadenosine phosphosulfate reductase